MAKLRLDYLEKYKIIDCINLSINGICKQLLEMSGHGGKLVEQSREYKEKEIETLRELENKFRKSLCS